MNINMDLSNGSEWELSKENVQPLKRGRKVANLSAALGSSSNDYQSKIHREKQSFEADIRTYEGDDPLEVWYRYFLWLCENFPTGGKDQITLLERCITVFKDEEKYKNDQRYLEIWMRYADMCSDPIEVYEYMHSQSVCGQLANFYKAWAYVLEELGNLKKADEVYKLGIAKNAQHLDILLRHHRAFEVRLAENVTRNTEQNFNNENDPQRTALVGLKGHGKKGTVGVKRTGSATLASKVGGLGYSKMSGNSKNPGFTVYCEDNISGMSSSSLPSSTGEWQMPPTKPITTKENTQNPGKWTDTKISQRHQRIVPVDNVGTKPSFTVHVDEEMIVNPPCTPQHGHVVMDKVLSSRKPDKDPTSELLRNIAKGDNEEKQFKVMYCKDKIYSGASEISFEQLRAARMFARLAGRPWSSLYPEQENQDEKKYKVMYPKNEVYTWEGERPYDEVILKQYFEHKKARMEKARATSYGSATHQVTGYGAATDQDTGYGAATHRATGYGAATEQATGYGAATHQIHTNSMAMITSGSELSHDCVEPMDTQEIRPVFQVCNDQENHSENHSARRGLSFNNSISEGQTDLKDKIFHDKSPSPLSNNDQRTMSSAFHAVTKGLQPRQALRDWPVPYEEPCSTTANTSNHSYITSDAMTTEMQHDHQSLPLPPTSNAFNTLPNMNQQSAFNPVTPGNAGAFGAFRRNTPGSADNYYSSPTVTMNTKAAQDVVLAMFSNPLGVDGDDNLPWMNRLQITGSDKDFEAAFCNNDKSEKRSKKVQAGLFEEQSPSFTPYIETEVDTQEDAAQDHIYDDNQENRPPSDYFQQKPERPILGVLQPSVGIPVCPLEQEKGQDFGDDEDYENLPPQGDQYDKTLRDVTEDANAFMATSNFKMAACMASTPFSQGLEPPSFALSTIRPPKEHEIDFTSVHSTEDYTANMFNCTPSKVLSPILEGSDEDTRSTTGSSASSISLGRGSVSHHVSHHMPPTASLLPSIAEDQTANQSVNQSVARQNSRLDSTSFQLNEDGTTDLNPFSDEVLEHLLERVVPPVSSYQGYYNSQKDDIPKIAPNRAVNLGADDLYRVEQCIGTGAFSKVFCAIKLNADLSSYDLNEEDEVVLKVQKIPNDWEFYVCRQLHTRIDNMQCERTMHALFMNPSDIYNYANGSVLVNHYNNAVTLLDVANKYKTSGKLINEIVAVLFAISLLRMLKTMHRCNIIHGDLKPDNILVMQSECFRDGLDLKLIDFGRSIDLQLFPPGTSFKVDCYTDGFQCIEMKTNKPWTTQVDTYGLLGTLHCLIHGEYMKEYQKEGRWKQNTCFKRHWNTQLWIKLFDTFLNTSSQDDVPSLTGQLLEAFEDQYRSISQTEVQRSRKNHDIIMYQD